MNMEIDIPGYQIIKQIGEGATASVWLAYHETLDRQVAIKILNPELLFDAAEIDAFILEARAVAKIQHHNVIQIYDIGRTDDLVFIIMEYIDGSSLSDLLASRGNLSPHEAFGIATDIADVLHTAWTSVQMIHRDIKPDNVMITSQGIVKLADLGLARMITQNQDNPADQAGWIVGTPNYMSPEQASGADPIDFTTDMYSLGATLYHMVTGSIPFGGLDAMQVLEAQQKQQLPNPADLNKALPVPCVQIITRLMMKDPQRRYPAWSRLRDDLNKVAAGKLVVIKPSEGISTIAAKGSLHAPASASPRRKVVVKKSAPTSTAPPSSTAPVRSKPHGVPKSIKQPLRILLALFVLWFLAQGFWIPWRHAAKRAAYEQRLAASREQQAQPVAEPQPAPAVAIEKNPEAPIAPELTEVPPELITSLLHQLILYQDETARRQWQTWLADNPTARKLTDVRTINQLLNERDDPLRAIEKVLETQVGSERSLELGDNTVDVRIEGVRDLTISGMIKTKRNTATVYMPTRFHIDQLSSATQLQLLRQTLSGNPSSFNEAIILMRNAQYEDAIRLADFCQPFDQAIRQWNESRIARLLSTSQP